MFEAMRLVPSKKLLNIQVSLSSNIFFDRPFRIFLLKPLGETPIFKNRFEAFPLILLFRWAM